MTGAGGDRRLEDDTRKLDQRGTVRMRLTDDERVWLAISRSLPREHRSVFIEAAEAIAAGRRPPPSPFRQANQEAPASA